MSEANETAPTPKAKYEPGSVGYAIGVLILLVPVGLVIWGLYAAGSWVSRGWNTIMEEGAQISAELEAADAEKRAAQAGQVSDVAVLAGAQMAIKARAVDPDSVRFRNLSVHSQDNGSKAVCGEFNAKNRAGGYNGFEPFISAGVAQHTWTREDVADFSTAWNSLCSR